MEDYEVVKKHSDPTPLCDVGGCDDPGVYVFKKYRVCPYHFAAYIDDAFDLDVYFQLFETKVLGNAPRVELEDLDPDELDAYLDALVNSDDVNDEVGDGGSGA